MTTFTWQVNGLQVMQEPKPNTVVMSNFTILGNDNDVQGSVTYSVNLLPANPKSFTSYDQVTHEQAITWTQEALGTDRVAAMEAEVQAQIDKQKMPVPKTATPPWEPKEPELQTAELQTEGE